ncbi:IclR family transcriptional regulator [Bacillus sp. X1(2014)]|uniref:IclR family transcriptional regulator n=1 Tax=Bacillus sp. X1(2014) TaxID=1565991 RepID=UPI0016428B3E|nr:IclR family transcriptional regulator [Bacillus sp. X1(2014)]
MRKLNIEFNHSVDKAIDILDVFTKAKPALTIEEIINLTGLPKATAYRLLYSLERRGIIHYDSNAATYKLGLQLFRYSRILSASLDILTVATPILTDLQRVLGQTVLMSLLEDENMVYVFKKESEAGLKFSSSVHESKPITYGVVGKVFMAYKPAEYHESLSENPIPKWTPHTVVDKESLMKQFEEIRQDRVAVEIDETNIGVTGIGSPIFNAEGEVFAAIGVVGPSIHFAPEEIERAKELTRQAGEKISTNLGYEK